MDQMYTRDLPLLISSLRAPCDNFRVRIIILNPRINLSKGYLFRKYVTQGILSWFLLLKKKKTRIGRNKWRAKCYHKEREESVTATRESTW